MTFANEQIAMTLAAIAYADEILGTTIEKLLSNETLATEGEWTLAWGPHKKETNLAFVVHDSGSDQYALVIRGTTADDPCSWLLDLETDLKEMPWPCSVPSAQISDGMVKVFEHLTTMPDFGAKKLQEYLNTIPSGSRLWVVGHSQAGASGSMMALWAAETFPSLDVYAYLFAGETAGNAGFATAFEGVFSAKSGGRYVNENDVVPRAFADLSSLPALYSSVNVSPPCLLKEWIQCHSSLENEYVQPQAAIVLPKSELYPPNPNPAERLVDVEYQEEVADQHSHIRYLWSMDAPYQAIDSKWVPPTSLKH